MSLVCRSMIGEQERLIKGEKIGGIKPTDRPGTSCRCGFKFETATNGGKGEELSIVTAAGCGWLIGNLFPRVFEGNGQYS